MNKRNIIFLILIISWVVLGVFWSDEFIGLFKHKPEMAMMARNVEESPVKDSIATTAISFQNIITGLIALVNAVFGSILLIQKVFGKR